MIKFLKTPPCHEVTVTEERTDPEEPRLPSGCLSRRKGTSGQALYLSTGLIAPVENLGLVIQ